MLRGAGEVHKTTLRGNESVDDSIAAYHGGVQQVLQDYQWVLASRRYHDMEMNGHFYWLGLAGIHALPVQIEGVFVLSKTTMVSTTISVVNRASQGLRQTSVDLRKGLGTL